jgi:hypothetical protein
LEPSVARVAFIAAAAWVSGLACIVVAAWHAGTVSRRRSPGVEALVERVRAAGEGGFAAAELRELRSEAERGLAFVGLLPRSLTRVALTTGTALGVLVLAAGGGDMAVKVVGALGAFAGGAVGTIGALLFGQRASGVARKAREEWRAHLREVERRVAGESSEPERPFSDRHGVDRG